jgi:hypothetical protein
VHHRHGYGRITASGGRAGRRVGKSRGCDDSAGGGRVTRVSGEIMNQPYTTKKMHSTK